MKEKFNFRGSPTSGQDFYMLAVLKKVDEFKNKNFPNFSHLGIGSEKYFFLCQNQYKNSSGEMSQRLYWSSDPEDFQKSENLNHQNQGVVRVNIFSSKNTNYLRYRTTFTNFSTHTPEPGVYKNFSRNLNRLSDNDQLFPVSFNLKNNKYNINTQQQLYYSIPYQISNPDMYLVQGFSASKGNEIPWVFRKIQGKTGATSSSGVTVPKPSSTPQQTDMIYNFVNLAALDTVTGTSFSKFNYGSVEYKEITSLSAAGTSFFYSDKVLKLNTHSSDFNILEKHNSDIKLIHPSSGASTVIYYNKLVKNGDTAEFYLPNSTYSKDLLGSAFEMEKNETNVSLLYNIRNSDSCFCEIGSEVDFSDYFDIYLIPEEEHANFPGGYHLNNRHVFPICSSLYPSEGGIFFTPTQGSELLSFFSPVSRQPASSVAQMSGPIGTNPQNVPSANNYMSPDCSTISDPKFNLSKLRHYKKIYNLLMFNEIGSLNNKIWSNTGITSFPTIAMHKQPFTFFTWDSWEASRNSYMYDYCVDNNFCGFCFGRNKAGRSICFADRLTRKHAVLTTSENVLSPLANEERYTGTEAEGGDSKNWLIGVYVFAGLLGALILMTFVYYGTLKKNPGTQEKIHISGGTMFATISFCAAVLAFMYYIAEDLMKCESLPSPACPQQSCDTEGESQYQDSGNDTCKFCPVWTKPDGTEVKWNANPY